MACYPVAWVKHPKFIKERQRGLFVFGNNGQHLLSNLNNLLLIILLHARAGEQVHDTFDTRCRQYITDVGLQLGL